MLYRNIPDDIYVKKSNELKQQLYELHFQRTDDVLGQTLFETNKYTLYFFIDDYAAFLAHSTEYQNEETLYLGLKAAQNFVTLWDHIGYSFYLT